MREGKSIVESLGLLWDYGYMAIGEVIDHLKAYAEKNGNGIEWVHQAFELITGQPWTWED